MVAAAKAAVPTVGDQAAALQLGTFAKATASALAELRAASGKVCHGRCNNGVNSHCGNIMMM